MKIAPTEMGGVQEILERKEAELARVLRKRDGIAIEKSADQMDEIQYASERDLAIRNVDRESILLRPGKSRIATDSRRQLWNLHRVRIGDQPKTPRGRAMGVALYPVPGGCRSGWAGENGILRRDSRQCRVNEPCSGLSLAIAVG